MPVKQLFISYRRDDSAGHARALHEALAREFGHERVFIDVDDIAVGQRFADVIGGALGASAVLLVLMGPRWAGPRAPASARMPARIFDRGDFVRREVEAGLAQGLLVVPLLLDGTPMPATDSLPTSLHPLLERQALDLDMRRFSADLERLLAALRPHLSAALPMTPGPGNSHAAPSAPAARAEPATPTAPAAPAAPAASPMATGRRAWAMAGVALAVAAGATWALWPDRGPGSGSGIGIGDLAGTWDAEVTYPWPNARYTERLRLQLQGDSLVGSASFLRVARVIEDVRLDGDTLHFITRSTSEDGSSRWEDKHRYRIQRQGDQTLGVQMQTESQGVVRPPLNFIARRLAAAPPD